MSGSDLERIAPAGAGPPLTVEALLELRRPAEAVVSPDGGRVAISVLDAVSADPATGPRGGIWIAEGDAPARRVTDPAVWTASRGGRPTGASSRLPPTPVTPGETRCRC